MKCKTCGGNYKTFELRCPYCNRENFLGKIWKWERNKAEYEYEDAKRKMGKFLISPYMLNRILDVCLIGIVIFYCISLFVLIGIFVVYSNVGKISNMIKKDEIESQMATYYEELEFEKLALYMEDKGINTYDYEEYTEAIELNKAYNDYMRLRMTFHNFPLEDKIQYNVYVEFILNSSAVVCSWEFGYDDETNNLNRELLETYQREIMAYWFDELQLSKEQVTFLADCDPYTEFTKVDEIVEEVIEREGWR